jgi:hypothetical protein
LIRSKDSVKKFLEINKSKKFMKTFREFISEAKDETEIGITGQPIPKKKMSAAKRYEFEKKRRENLKKRTGETGDSRLIQALRAKAKREGTFVEAYKDLTPEKEKRVKEKVGELARNVQLKSARVKDLRKKPFAKFRPGVKSEIKANIKSAKKDAKLVRNASDALTRTSIDRSAKMQKKIEDLKRRENS